MTSVNVQFREDEETIKFLVGRGLKPSEVAKASFEREVRRLQAEAHAEELAALGVKLPDGLAERAVRASRDSR
ncbi:MAG: hypothetical protein QOE90_3074 [Thermoplasmata archaeon]|jgi:hypothetical protein|nr:hypothetical protein [Thermoplasmata archaeon]